jgi:hypothetical protein
MKYEVLLPDGSIAKRTSNRDYHFVVAVKGKHGWGARGWRAKEQDAISHLRGIEKRARKYGSLVEGRVIPI